MAKKPITKEEKKRVLANFELVDTAADKVWMFAAGQLDHVEDKTKRWILMGRIVARVFAMHFHPTLLNAKEALERAEGGVVK